MEAQENNNEVITLKAALYDANTEITNLRNILGQLMQATNSETLQDLYDKVTPAE